MSDETNEMITSKSTTPSRPPKAAHAVIKLFALSLNGPENRLAGATPKIDA